jgi:asparagine synthase (glutamine-hydrolysing)
LPNLSSRLKVLGRPMADRLRHPRWIPAAFARRVNLYERLRANAALADAGTTPSMRESLHGFWCGERAFALDRIVRSAEWWGIELRHPFLDRRVVEATIALPDDQRWRNGRTKDVLRRAMGDVLPPVIRDRLDKAHFSDMMPAAIEMLEPERWLRSSVLADAGFIDAAMLRDMLAALRRWNHGGPPMYEVRDPIWNAIGAEAWMRQEGFGR